MFYIGECRICGTGPLGLRTCGACGQVVVLCDECDAVWIDADTAGAPIFSHDPELPCPDCAASLWDSPSHWASRAEIEATDWIIEALAGESIQVREAPPENESPDDRLVDDDASNELDERDDGCV